MSSKLISDGVPSHPEDFGEISQMAPELVGGGNLIPPSQREARNETKREDLQMSLSTHSVSFEARTRLGSSTVLIPAGVQAQYDWPMTSAQKHGRAGDGRDGRDIGSLSLSLSFRLVCLLSPRPLSQASGRLRNVPSVTVQFCPASIPEPGWLARPACISVQAVPLGSHF